VDTSAIINIVLIIVAVWFLYTRLAPTKGLRTLSYKDFGQELQSQKNPILIDVREAGEFNIDSIPGAINIPLSQLKNKVSEIPKDKNVYLYCRSGMRSKQAAGILRKQGYTQMAHLQGGIMAWHGKIKK